MIAKIGLRVVLLTSLFLVVGVLAARAQGVGAIGGIVTDASGGVLPGATVTLSAPGIIGGNQTAVTDDRGAYQFTRLVPGQYSVKAELQGFTAAVQENIGVNSDRTSRADLKLAVGTLAEDVTVTTEAPLLDTTSTLKQAVMTREVLDTVPVGNDIWSISRLAEGVRLSKYDVGGRQMFGQSNAVAHNSFERGYQVDGMDINSYAGGISFYVGSFQFQEINYQTDNVPASGYEGGVVMNMVTKTGTNLFHGTGMIQYTNHSLEANNVTGTLATQIAAGVPAKVLQVNPGLFLGGDTVRLYDMGVTFGGPVVRDRVWFAGSGYLGSLYSHLLGSYNTDGTLLLNDNMLKEPFGKVSWAINRENQLHVTEAWVSVGRYHQAGGPTVTQYFSSDAAFYNTSANTLQMARWTRVMPPKMVLDVAAMTTEGQTNQPPEPGVANGTIPKFDNVLLTNTDAAATYTINSGRRTEFAASLAYSGDKHQITGGWQYYVTQNERGFYNLSNYPAGFRAVYANGVPNSVNTYNSPTDYFNRSHETGIYVQDKWTPTNKLTLNVGVRYDKSFAWLNDAAGFGWTVDAQPLCQQQTIFVAGQCFPAIKGAPDFNSFSPRFAAVYDVRGNGSTALKFSANRYMVPVNSNWAWLNRVNPIATTNDTRAWRVCTAGQTSGCDLNGDGIPQLNEFGPSSGFSLGTANRYASGVAQPYDLEVSAAIEQQLPAEMVVSAAYYYRTYRNNVGPTNVLAPASAYTPINVVEATSGAGVTVYNLDPSLRGKFDYVWSNMSALDMNFHGVDLSLNKRMSHHWSAMASLSLGKSEGDIYCSGTVTCTGASGDFNNPNLGNRRGPSSQDVPVFAKASLVYELPKGFSVGAVSQYFQGWPDTTTVTVGANTVALTQVSQSIVVAPSATTRLPSVNMSDFNLRKRFAFGSMTFEPRVDIFNAFNQVAVTQRITILGPTNNRPIAVVPGRLIKFGVNLTF